MFEPWPAQQMDVKCKEEPGSADAANDQPSTSSGRAKRTRRPTQRAVEMDTPQLARQGSGNAATAAAPSTSASASASAPFGGQPRGRGRQRANPDAPETAQQRAHRKFYLRKKEALSSLEAIAAAKLEEYEALRAENAALTRKHAGLAATVAGRDTMLGVLSAISNLSLQDGQQQIDDTASQQQHHHLRQQEQWLQELVPGPLQGAQQQLQEALPAYQRQQSLTPSLESEQRTWPQGVRSDGCTADDGAASVLFASTSEQLMSDQLDEEGSLLQQQQQFPAADELLPLGAVGRPDGNSVPDVSAEADAAMAQLLAGFMEGLEANGGTAARAALEASLTVDMQPQQQQQQQQQHEQQLHCHRSAHDEPHDSSSSLSSNTMGNSSCCSGSNCEPGSSGSNSGKGAASCGPYSFGGMVSWYGGAIKQLGAQLQALEEGDGGALVQEELERQVKEIMDRLRKFAALDRVHHREMMLINMETRERATPPRGHWERVVASAPLTEAQTAQLLACHDVFTEHIAAVRQERTALVQELQRAISSMPQGDAALGWSAGELAGPRQLKHQGGELSLLDGMTPPAQQGQQWQQQRQLGSLSEAEAALMLMGDLWEDRRQQQQPTASLAWDQPSSSSVAAQPRWASRAPIKPKANADLPDACLMAANMTLLNRINDNLAREDLVNNMLAYALSHVLSVMDVARSMVAAWPFYPDTPEVVAATVAAAAAEQAPAKACAAQPARSPLTC